MTYYLAEGIGDYTSPGYRVGDIGIVHWFRAENLDDAVAFAWRYFDWARERCQPGDVQSYWVHVVDSLDPWDVLEQLHDVYEFERVGQP